eukprot:10644647-Prorocentrum_lima.AAC.1
MSGVSSSTTPRGMSPTVTGQVRATYGKGDLRLVLANRLRGHRKCSEVACRPQPLPKFGPLMAYAAD